MFLHLTITTFNVIDSRLCVWWVGDTVLTFLLSFRHTQNCLAWSLIMDHEAGLRGHTHRTQVIRIFLLHMFYILRPLTLLLMLRRQDDGTLMSFYDTRHSGMQLEFGFLCMVVLENLFGALGCLCGPWDTMLVNLLYNLHKGTAHVNALYVLTR